MRTPYNQEFGLMITNVRNCQSPSAFDCVYAIKTYVWLNKTDSSFAPICDRFKSLYELFVF